MQSDNAGRDRVYQNQKKWHMGKLAQDTSGILKVTSYNDLYSFLIYMGDTTARDIGGYWTIERIGQ